MPDVSGIYVILTSHTTHARSYIEYEQQQQQQMLLFNTTHEHTK